MRTFLLFLLMASLSIPALAQAPPRLDPTMTRPAVRAPTTSHPSRGARLIRDTLIGGAAGAATGFLLWAAARDCQNGTCGAGPQHAIVTTGLFGASVGAWIGVVQGWGAGHHPDIRMGPHVAFAHSISRSHVEGVVRVGF